ncbi:S1 RNA-binding domain-containing protein [Weissella diestrammenae]|uniref:S1 RNA-binding domain-containing protein n=1 Tax=Weissella diestrammenae TaxID=1162633 RepID=A0A7G9T661_9LACO|nr:CvfD/Ygs/GSP13 family RNA-binding post-transcriptional regulator [Weissella diestrammenae]MCM0583374.1 S1 RNA-binding domain-containing protein [Weissella diestrammenae]QNN75586.1 S1 RNA-binding domain-containing protein [Weissella diestrammenae]
MGYQIGQIVMGTVTGIQPYGAFVQLDSRTQGLIHISECRSAFIKCVDDELAVGMTIQVMILDIDEYNGKVSLSRRSVVENGQKLLSVSGIRNTKGRNHYWTNQYLDFGFSTIAKAKNEMLNEALNRLRA